MAKFTKSGKRQPFTEGKLILSRMDMGSEHERYRLMVRGEELASGKVNFYRLELSPDEAKRFIEFYKTNIDHLR